ncbi:uncharacterized protein EV422DRAFT_208727 [Fimicolochytrium jonesii]|uniref:uncharacterized protein n=1 Tax=Fimicolochytrium jonesii TaxID=1396493 RepID=UPI0022FF0E97|nr:uncharacterized protein EV422DRAFT_208727 [Fimicolochytrium jonesii]KAI8817860.1 hypothetical protein EV422DRAFT_208727 [Fimicolochytrium jonesii]
MVAIWVFGLVMLGGRVVLRQQSECRSLRPITCVNGKSVGTHYPGLNFAARQTRESSLNDSRTMDNVGMPADWWRLVQSTAPLNKCKPRENVGQQRCVIAYFRQTPL